MTLTNDLVGAQAAIFYSKFYPLDTKFKAAASYAQAFCKRNNFKTRTQFGEQLSADLGRPAAHLRRTLQWNKYMPQPRQIRRRHDTLAGSGLLAVAARENQGLGPGS